MKLKKLKVVLCLTVLLVSTILFYPGQKSEAASESPSHMQLLIFSHLAYSIMDAYPRGTSLGKINFEKDKWVKDFRDSALGLTKDQYISVPPSIDSTITAVKVGNSVFKASDTPTSILKRYNILDWQIYDYLYNKKSGFFGVIFYNKTKKQYVVSYRGTNGMTDVPKDIEIFMSTYKYPEEAQKLISKIPSYSSKNTNITITGHSLGGFIAQNIASLNKKNAVTFNAPGFDKRSSVYRILSPIGDKYVVNYVMTGDTIAEVGKNIGVIKRFNGGTYEQHVGLHRISNFYKYLK